MSTAMEHVTTKGRGKNKTHQIAHAGNAYPERTFGRIISIRVPKSYDAFLHHELRDPELAAAYLSAAIEDGSTEQFLIALRAVAEANGGVSAIADAAHLNRQAMYRTLSRHGNPTISTLLPLLKAMGLHLSFAPAVGQ